MMGISGQTLNNCKRMDSESVLQALDANRPYRRTFRLHRNRQSLRVTVPSDCWQEAGRSLDEPGEAEVYYLPDEGVMVVDLDGEE